MITMALHILAGALIGWATPQPKWAKKLTDWLKEQFAKLKAKLFG